MSFGTSFALTTRPVVMGRTAAVVAGHHLAADAGMQALRAGGNAVDAAIAAAAALAVLKPDACGAGSDLFMLYSEAKTGNVYALNASGPAPQAATREAFPDGKISGHGLQAASVPGAVDAWERALKRFGRRSLADALGPAIDLARNGMPVSSLLASTLEKNESSLRTFPATFAVFCPQGRAPRSGEILVQADLAKTLESIARDGAASFYRGAFAAALDAHARNTGAPMRASDLANYESEWREPVSARYRGYELVGQPPISVGLSVLEALQIIERFPLPPADSADFIHLHVEAMKLAMSDVRGHIGDPAFVDPARAAALLDPAYVAARARAFDPMRAGSPKAGDLLARTGTDTSYFAAIDAEGNAVSLLQSVFHVLGSLDVIPGTGVLMNNRMTGFSLDPASPNVLEPGKRTMHTLNPLLIRKDGATVMCLGTPGGPSQTYTNSIVLTRVIDRDQDIQQALDAPRWFVSPEGDLHIESSIPEAVREELAARGHRLVTIPPRSAAMGGAGLVRLAASGVREAAADPRRESYAVAY